ncbi:MAG TPA: DNA primase [Casimicrobiaceae bacterium]|jgi:DNA primase
MIPNDFISTLLSRVDIVQVIDRYVPLKKAGANYQACCPFHSEKTPSFTVSPTKQFYHCFGCGAHGTAVGFLMEHGGKSFPDAVEELARDVGLEVPRLERPGDKERQEASNDIGAVLLTAAKFYRAKLKESSRAIDYLKSRGLTGTVAARFGVGYAPDDWQALETAFPDYAADALVQAGLVINGDGGKRYDRFRDRVMFPIHDSRGRVIGFGGRVIDQGEPKYLNSPETTLFSKGRELYGLFLARDAIHKADRVVVVEGYMDVVALAQHGVEYAVATLGTSTTPVHAQKLFRMADTVVFCFDGDAAGRKAAWRALENTLPLLVDGKNARFLFLPDGDDPDDYVRKHGKAGFEHAVENAVPLSEFLLTELSSRYPPVNAEGRAALVAAARPLLASITAPILGALMRRQLGALSGLSEEELPPLLAQVSRTPELGRRSSTATPRTRVRRAPSLARELIQAILLKPDLARLTALPRWADGTPEGNALAALVETCAAAEVPLSTGAVMQSFASSIHEPVLAAALATAEDQSLTAEHAEARIREGIERWWLWARRDGRAGMSEGSPLDAEEAERLRQLEYVRRASPGDKQVEP